MSRSVENSLRRTAMATTLRSFGAGAGRAITRGMKNKFLPLFVFFFSSVVGHAVTLDMENFIKQRIGRAKPVPIESLAEIFKDSPSFRYECVIDSAKQAEPSERAAEVLTDFVPVAPSGLITFYYQELNYGFDIGINKSLDEVPKRLPPGELITADQPSDSLNCAAEENFTCKALTLDKQKVYDIQLSEWFKPGMDISESMSFTIFDHNQIYMNYSVSFGVVEVGRWNQRIGAATYSKHYVCALKPATEIVPRLR